MNKQLQTVVENVNKHYTVIVTGNVNDKFGANNKGYERTMDKHETGNINSNGEALIEFCGMNDVIT